MSTHVGKAEQKLINEGWEQVGVFSVDSGLCLIGDPCYHAAENRRPKALGNDWSDFCDNLKDSDFDENRHSSLNHDAGHEGFGVLLSTGYGDGVYSVYVMKDDFGHIAQVKIVFIDDQKKDD